MAVVRRQVLVQLTQVQELVYAAEKVVCRDVVFEVEGVEQGRLPGFLTSHHRCDFRWIDGKSVDQLQPVDSTEFFNGIDPKRTLLQALFANLARSHAVSPGIRREKPWPQRELVHSLAADCARRFTVAPSIRGVRGLREEAGPRRQHAPLRLA
jgi:hypothetical protein